jgi:uncharacterized phage-associated protein
MANVQDVARYILDRLASDPSGKRVTSWKLQKLVYYAQAWSLVWDEQPLFTDEIQAWANGPVCPALYSLHRGRFGLCASDISGNPSNLTEDERETIDAVIAYYGDKTGTWLSDLTHMERPWKQAREGIADGEPSQNVISHESMLQYYESIQPGA